MKCIEENSEQLDLLHKTLSLEAKQRKRLLQLTIEQDKQIEAAKNIRLHNGNGYNPNSQVLDKEEAEGKELVRSMVQNASPAIAPVVRVLTNVQGKPKQTLQFFGQFNFTEKILLGMTNNYLCFIN